MAVPDATQLRGGPLYSLLLNALVNHRQPNLSPAQFDVVVSPIESPDGETIHAAYENKEDNTTTRSEMRKQEQ